jgi:hypothetical protein
LFAGGGTNNTCHCAGSPREGVQAVKLWSVNPRPLVVVPLFLLAASLSAGCSSDDPAETASSVTVAAPSAPTGDGSSDAPPFPGDERPDTADASADSRVTVRDIRIGRQDGFDRVVFEVGGTGTPGWDVRYVDEAVSQGSGEPVEAAGDAVLQVSVTGAGYPYDTGVPEWAGPDPLSVAGTEVVTEVVFDATFEGTTVAFVGTTARSPFRVYLLEGPARVVVEIADAG